MRSMFRRAVSAAVSALLVGTTATACFAEPSVLPTVRDFLIAWQVGNYQAAARHTTGNPAAVRAALAQITDQLDAASLRLRMGQIRKKGNEANARFEVKVDLGENGEPWQYLGQMNLRRIDGEWKVVWSPSIVHPDLGEGERLAIVTESPPRGEVQAVNGGTLLQTVRADIFGVYPGAVRNIPRTINQLARDTRLDSERLIGRVRSAPPNEFLPLVTLQQPLNYNLGLKLRRIDGLAVRTIDAEIAPRVSAELVGRLGPATSARLQEVGAPYQPGDTIGVSGLQMLYQRRLAGIPAVKVVIEDREGKQEVLREWRGQSSAHVRTTLKSSAQLKAERTLAQLRFPASLVAVHRTTGEILAVANHGTGQDNRAMEGSYPPGLTFGIVSAEALMLKGMGANKQTDCPATTKVDGQTFTNPGPARGKSTFQMNFAFSCATTLASLSKSVDTDTLMREIDRFGVGKQWGLPVPAFSGSVPRPRNDAEKANIMLGQGGVRVSPLTMALVAGAADSGTWRPPTLLSDPAVPRTLQAQPLEPDGFQDLRLLTRRSVFQGTAKAARVPGGATVYGVSAAVNYTDGGQQKTVSWFVGSQGEYAFAIAIEGKASAAQLARRFLTLP
ncbi:penicillin-binding transpeptidase domain-containing protein [Actinomadura alba]|uniref:NTF2 domain-containing protein transpeptidase n=1 Tax=Actinomadura alba TaxID=406431 RepID=A0ABR7LJG1_9ACTN|nr:penicillin-binding transpeptidase domain-containing protein [Actinomadura alba]MBC6464904.1 NTF2 domain-containing protein transpeptidase [Actinomadura alba]